jgi:hypothetical protein
MDKASLVGSLNYGRAVSLEEAQRRTDEWTDGPLDLSELGLSSVPESLGNLTNLAELWLSRNQLSSLPVSFTNLGALTLVDMNPTSSRISGSDGLYLGGGNRWSDEFRQAADQGIEALWEHIKNTV